MVKIISNKYNKISDVKAPVAAVLVKIGKYRYVEELPPIQESPKEDLILNSPADALLETRAFVRSKVISPRTGKPKRAYRRRDMKAEA